MILLQVMKTFVACIILLLNGYIYWYVKISKISLNIRPHTLTYTWMCSCLWSCSDNSAEVISQQCRNVLPLRDLKFLQRCRCRLLSSGLRSLSQLRLTPHIYVSVWCWHSFGQFNLCRWRLHVARKVRIRLTSDAASYPRRMKYSNDFVLKCQQKLWLASINIACVLILTNNSVRSKWSEKCLAFNL